MVNYRISLILHLVPIDRNSLPKDPEILQLMLIDLTQQLDKTQRLLRQLLAAKSGTRSEQLSADQLRLFAQELSAGPCRSGETASQDNDRHHRMAPAIAMRTKAARADVAPCRRT